MSGMRSIHAFHILPACAAGIANAGGSERLFHHVNFAAAFGIHAAISFMSFHGHDLLPMG